MLRENGTAHEVRKPFAFLSSFTREFGGWLPDGTPDKNSLRYKIHELGQRMGKEVWVAEASGMDLKGKTHFDIIDSLWEKVRTCSFFICILGGDRRGHDEHGTRVMVSERAAAVSFFEAELVLAALLGKPIDIFIAKGFDPGPRLSSLLELLRFALPAQNWRGPADESSILREIERILRTNGIIHSILPKWMPTTRRRMGGWLLSKMYDVRALSNGQLPGKREIFFLDSIYEPSASKPDKDLIEQTLKQAHNFRNIEGQLARLWIAIRELAALPIGADCPSEYLLLWNEALGRWGSSAAWYGLQGPPFLSQLAAFHSVAKVRTLLRKTAAKKLPMDTVEHPGGLASALYSTAKLMPSNRQRRMVFEEGLAHLNETIQQRGELTANLAQIRGSFNFQMDNIPRAIEDYEIALKRRYSEKAGPGQIGESLSELGFAHLRQMRIFKGRDFLEEGIKLMREEREARPGFYARGLRKLAVGYAVTGRWFKAYETRAEFKRFVEEKQLFDQLR